MLSLWGADFLYLYCWLLLLPICFAGSLSSIHHAGTIWILEHDRNNFFRLIHLWPWKVSDFWAGSTQRFLKILDTGWTAQNCKSNMIIEISPFMWASSYLCDRIGDLLYCVIAKVLVNAFNIGICVGITARKNTVVDKNHWRFWSFFLKQWEPRVYIIIEHDPANLQF